MRNLRVSPQSLLHCKLSRRDALTLPGMGGTSAVARGLLSEAAPTAAFQSDARRIKPLRREITARHPLFMVEEGTEMCILLLENLRIYSSLEASTWAMRIGSVKCARPPDSNGLQGNLKSALDRE